MRINEIKASLAASQTEATPTSADQTFLSIGELLVRVQRTPDTTMQQAADCLLSWGLLMEGAPQILVNSKTRGVVPADKRGEKLAIGRLEYVFHRGQFESDGCEGASIDYDLFGFDRKEFADFLANRVGEELELFSPISDDSKPGAPPAPAPDTKSTASAPRLQHWKMQIQEEATNMFLRGRNSGASPTVYSIKDELAAWCRTNNVKTDGGIFPSGEYLRVHVLSSKHWTPPA